MPKLLHQAFWKKRLKTITNGDFSKSQVISSIDNTATISGWKIYSSRVFFGRSVIEGYTVPVGSNRPQGDLGSASPELRWQVGQVRSNSITLSTLDDNPIDTAYGAVHGPYMVSDTIAIVGGDVVQFDWSAVSLSDAYDLMIYFLNIGSGATIIAVDRRAAASNEDQGWTTYKKTFSDSESGSYKIVFIGGTWDSTGGRALGANFSVKNVTFGADYANVRVPPPTVTVSGPEFVDEGTDLNVNVSVLYPTPTDYNTLYWTTQTVSGNVTSGDFSNVGLSGSVATVNNFWTRDAQITIPVTADVLYEGEEIINVVVRTNSVSGNIVGYTGNISIFDPGVRTFTFDADYILLESNIVSGRDLDLRVGLASPPGIGTTYLGWSATARGLKDGDWFTWGGDNSGLGSEAVLFDVAKFKMAYPNVTEVKIDFRCFWFGNVSPDPVTLKITLWKSGTPEWHPYSWANILRDDQLIIDSPGKLINLQVSSDATIGERLGVLTYNFITKRGKIDITDTTTPIISY